MSLGSALTSRIDIDFTRAQGVASEGQILFQPPRQPVGTTMLSGKEVCAKLINGVATIDLVRLPQGSYRVVEQIDGRPNRSYNFALSLTAPSVVQYEQIVEVHPVPVKHQYVSTINGIPPDPITGNINISGSGGELPDATGSVKGILKLTGDLGGTADSPALSLSKSAEISGKYVKPGSGIPASDLATSVQSALSLASSATQPADLVSKAPLASPTFTGTSTFARIIRTPVALTDLPTITINAALGNRFFVELAGNRALAAPTNPVHGQEIVIEIKQDATGNRTLTLGSGAGEFAFGADIPAPLTLSTAPDKTDFLAAIYNATANRWRVVSLLKGY